MSHPFPALLALEARGVDMDYVLYTDTDVLFARDWPARDGAGKGCEIPNFKGSYLGRFPLVSADFWTSDHLSERSRSLYFFSGRARARETLTLKRHRITLVLPRRTTSSRRAAAARAAGRTRGAASTV